MMDATLNKDRLPQLIEAMSKEYVVYGPKAHDDVIGFHPIGSADELVLDYRNSDVSPKELFLPRTEVVYEFDGDNFVDEAVPDEKRVIIGVRPCDCRALTMLDLVFETEEIQDPFYATRRANTVLIALACNQPLSTCFCTALGGDPFGEEGADILMADMDGSLLAKAITPKGEELLASYGEFFSQTSGAGGWDEQAEKARNAIKTELDVKALKSRLDELFEDNIWETESRKCLSCGVCSYLCPTCYCFDLTDEVTATGSRKVRRWDCCMLALFTLHASGHNPRPVKAARLRQRIMHKFDYYVESYGVSSCVGCGRCVRSCPVNLDIRQVLGDVMRTAGTAAEK